MTFGRKDMAFTKVLWRALRVKLYIFVWIAVLSILWVKARG